MAIILDMVIFPLVFLKFSLGLICLKIRRKGPCLTVLVKIANGCPPAEDLTLFSHPLEVHEYFSLRLYGHAYTVRPATSLAFFCVLSLKLAEKAHFGELPNRGKNIASGETPG